MSKTAANKNDLKFVDFKPNYNDSMDVPFRILGHKLRWLGARSNEDKFTRPYKILRKSDLSNDIIKRLEEKSINVFRDGDTVRHGENVLGYCSNEAYDAWMERVHEQTESQRQSIGQDNADRPGVRYDKKETGVERINASAFNE